MRVYSVETEFQIVHTRSIEIESGPIHFGRFFPFDETKMKRSSSSFSVMYIYLVLKAILVFFFIRLNRFRSWYRVDRVNNSNIITIPNELTEIAFFCVCVSANVSTIKWYFWSVFVVFSLPFSVLPCVSWWPIHCDLQIKDNGFSFEFFSLRLFSSPLIRLSSWFVFAVRTGDSSFYFFEWDLCIPLKPYRRTVYTSH